MMTDPIADMLTRIRNAVHLRRETVAVRSGSLWRNGTRLAEGVELTEPGLVLALADQQSRVTEALEAFAGSITSSNGGLFSKLFGSKAKGRAGIYLDVTVVPRKRTLEALREIVNIGKDFAGAASRLGLTGTGRVSGAALHVLDEFSNLITVLIAGDGNEAEQGRERGGEHGASDRGDGHLPPEVAQAVAQDRGGGVLVAERLEPLQPAARFRDRLRRGRNAKPAGGQRLDPRAALCERQLPHRLAVPHEHVEHHVFRRDLRRQHQHVAGRRQGCRHLGLACPAVRPLGHGEPG